MTDNMIPAALAAALSAKGYETLTPVQQAMLAPETRGRDALVSAQTGSGKTVAFGLAIAPTILPAEGPFLFAERPLALAIAPTRELALQVRRELEWLFANAEATIASCVGGMDYRNERRALERGAQIVVGTPGRLRDHIERGSLDLSGLRAVVLDEADEMLDLGFAEDLEFILAAAPEERQTLMFSATVPAEIAKLAQNFQKDAMRIEVQGEARQHADIEYRAFSVAARDRDGAIFNTLRFHESQTAIVFCKTRANVNHLFARMGNRGFQAVALSGELSQQERTHALQALRDGRAKVCIATDVAARGIDLPGLDLVVHADLPSNPETLLHRSGRTGRAGRKGTSVLIVPPADFRKANRILQAAQVRAEWGKAPSADEVQAREDARLLTHPALTEPGEDEATLVQAILDRVGPAAAAAGFVRLWREGRSAPEELSDNLPPAAPLPVRPRGEFGPSAWYSINVGHEGRAEARWLLPKICDTAGIGKDGIGAIRVQRDETWVQIAEPLAPRFGTALELEPGLTMTRIEGEPAASAAPARRPAPRREAASTPAPRAARPRPVRDEAERPFTWDEDRRPAAEEPPRRPYAPRDADAPRKPYAPRPAAADGDAPRKAYKPRTAERDAPRKPYGPRDADAPRKPYALRDADAPRKPYAPRPAAADGDAPRKPRWAARDRSEGEAEAPRRPARPFSPGKAAGSKSHGGARATGFKSHKTAAPKPAGDARDTSKRFTPPKRPRG